MPRVLDLADVLQLVIDGLDQRSLPQEQFIPEAHHAILHVLADFRQELEPLGQEGIVECLGNIAAIAKELAEEPVHEARDGLPVVAMAWRQLKGEEVSFIVHDEMQFEAIELTHRGLAAGRKALKDLVRRNAMIVTHGQRRRVDKGNPGAAAFARVERTTQGDEGAGQQFHKARVAAQAREIGA
jgi:hypothetical protein